MKLKSLMVLFALASLFLIGCGDGWNPVKVRAGVNAEFPDSEVSTVPGKKYSFIVRRRNGEVLYAEYMGNDAVSTSTVVLFGPK